MAVLRSYLEEITKDFCSYFNVSVSVVDFENEKVPVVKLGNSSEVIRGFRNIVFTLSKNNSKDPEYPILLDQWIEYAVTNAAYLQNSSNMTYILKELDEFLSDKVYFIGNQLSPVDVLIYFFVYDIMVSFGFQEKEKYLNVSRWFGNIQENKNIRNLRIPLCFSRTRLFT